MHCQHSTHLLKSLLLTCEVARSPPTNTKQHIRNSPTKHIPNTCLKPTWAANAKTPLHQRLQVPVQLVTHTTLTRHSATRTLVQWRHRHTTSSTPHAATHATKQAAVL